ncbi:MAG TPA: hypothetical protein VFR04_03100 [Solirubrobacterales bacterium]|nr:hypothetical protein [Solirubrobacterales bacterium]
MRRLAGTVGLLLALIGASSAPAAVEVGSDCESNALLVAGIEEIVFPLTTASPTTLPTSIPVNGIATRWTVRSGSTNTFYQRLKVLRTATGDTVQVVAEAPSQPVVKGSASFPIRIPVQAGDRFGLSGVGGGVIACVTGAAGDVVGATARNGQPGQSESFARLTGSQLALSVAVEPDADGDGYGDETQDGCPEAVAIQATCPRVTVVPKSTVKERAILVQVKVSSEASVQVFGQVSWKVRPRPAQGTMSRPRDHGLTVGLSAGGARTVLPSPDATFRLPLGRAVKRRLGRLDSSQALRARLTARITDLAGRVLEQQFRVRLPGRG